MIEEFNSLAQKLKDYRTDHDYTQSYISSYLEMSRGGYSQYELGNRRPSYEVLLKLAALYKIPIDDLLNPETVPISRPKGFIKDTDTLIEEGIIKMKDLKKLYAMLANNPSGIKINEITHGDIDFLIRYKLLNEEARNDIRLYVLCKRTQMKKKQMKEKQTKELKNDNNN